jgi:hypothetical protein
MTRSFPARSTPRRPSHATLARHGCQLGIDRDSRPEAEDAAQPIVPVYDPAIREHLEHADREGFRQPESDEMMFSTPKRWWMRIDPRTRPAAPDVCPFAIERVSQAHGHMRRRYIWVIVHAVFGAER